MQSLSGHTSGIDSVSFDSSEVLVAAGAASGTIKLWDLEEAKSMLVIYSFTCINTGILHISIVSYSLSFLCVVVRTLTGHRSNCISVDFHPFGEFFASGSLDTNLKIWDIRKKGCIHTYKGHTRGVSAIRFTPDGRWVVSGGEDNTVKVITAFSLLVCIMSTLNTRHASKYRRLFVRNNISKVLCLLICMIRTSY